MGFLPCRVLSCGCGCVVLILGGIVFSSTVIFLYFFIVWSNVGRVSSSIEIRKQNQELNLKTEETNAFKLPKEYSTSFDNFLSVLRKRFFVFLSFRIFVFCLLSFRTFVCLFEALSFRSFVFSKHFRSFVKIDTF
jgi:hypothetical protein